MTDTPEPALTGSLAASLSASSLPQFVAS